MNIGQIIEAAKFDEDDHHKGTRGWCGTFAINLFKMFPGGTLVLVTYFEGDSNLMNDGTYRWCHCAVRYGDKYYDVLGETTAYDLIDNYVRKIDQGVVVEVGERAFWRSLRAVPGSYSVYCRRKWKQKLLRAIEHIYPTALAA